MIDPKKELFKWGPIDGKVKYIDIFMDFFVTYQKDKGYSWTDSINFVANGKTTVILDNQDLTSAGERIFKRYILDDKMKKIHYDLWYKTTLEIEAISMDIKKDQFKNLSGKELLLSFTEIDKLLKDFWDFGYTPELANWGGEQMLKRELLKHHKDHFTELLETLSAPENISFHQVEELELLRIKLIKDKEERMEALKEHQKNYFWISNSYGHVEVLPVSHFSNILKKISLKSAQSKIKEIESYVDGVKRRKADDIKKHKVSKNILKIAENLSFCIWWQDLRKKYIFMTIHIMNEYTKEFARRYKIDYKDLDYYTRTDFFRLLEKGIKVKNIKDRKKAYMSYYHEKENVLTYIYGKNALDFINPYLEVKVDLKSKEIKGLVVSRGKAKGKVKILFTPKDAHKMKKGDILVAPMTSPDYVVAMRKASAIVTDEGGMTCHAAIVSRELKKPCIVGTKVATRLLKDGDMVEVDAEKGIVRKIK